MSRITRDIADLIPSQGNGFALRPQIVEFISWLPLIVLPTVVCLLRNALVAWVFMWALAFALFFGCKWLTWWRCNNLETLGWRNWAYLFGWPGMDAKAFLDARRRVAVPAFREWFAAALRTAIGATLVWKLVKFVPLTQPLLAGWTGLFGFVLILHFGTFQLLALMWRRLGVDAQPLMLAPTLSKTLSEFWGKRWNSAFNLLIHTLLFRKTYRTIGITGATMIVFLASGIIHELVISFPARGGYGLPTGYFLLQGVGLCLERSDWFQRFGGAISRCFTIIVAAVPAFWLFHPQFIRNVILPMLHAIGAT